MAANIAVIGGGVVGLSTALNIQSQIHGSRVKVVAEKFDSETTSYGSGGIWLVTLKHKSNPEEQFRRWCRGSWDFYRSLATGPEAGKCGACICNGFIVARREYPDPLFKEYVFSYRKLKDDEFKQLNFASEYKHGYTATTIVLDQRKYLKWLMARISENGGEFENRKVHSMQEFVGKYDVVMNCTGLGSRDLVGDRSVFAVRGQVLKVKAPWIKHWVADLEPDMGYSTFIIPGENFITFGVTQQVRDENLQTSTADTEDVLRRVSKLLPSGKAAQIDHVWVGLRPDRDKIRLEAENMQFANITLNVVHNYGHASDGVATSWGTAMEATSLAKQCLQKPQARL